MKYLVFGSLVLLSGCGVSGTAPITGAPQADVRHDYAMANPTVVFVGDQTTIAMFTPAFHKQNPTWYDAAVAGQTMAQALAGFQEQCVSRHPQVCHIMIGLNDIIAEVEDENGPQNSEGIEPGILQMIQEATAANIQVVVATEFPSFLDFTEEDDFIPPVDAIAGPINFWMIPGDPPILVDTPPFPANIVVANYWAPLTGGCGDFGGYCDYLAGLSTDDITPNAAGYAVMYPVMQAAIQKALTP
jgi:acyl-CoA thioesterase I